MSELDEVAALIRDHVQVAFMANADELFARPVIEAACYGDKAIFALGVTRAVANGWLSSEELGPEGKEKAVWLTAKGGCPQLDGGSSEVPSFGYGIGKNTSARHHGVWKGLSMGKRG